MAKRKFLLKDVKAAASGHWQDILPRFGITLPKLGQHAACPVCGGQDRFKFDDKYKNGDWLCNNCTESKNKDGFELIKRVCTNLTLPQVIQEVASIVGLDDQFVITNEMRKQWAQERQIRERVQRELEEKKQLQVARQAQGLFRNAYLGDSSPYLDSKGVPALPGIKVDRNGNVLIPAYDEKGTMWNMQTIYADGGKYFVSDNEDPEGDKKGGRTGGCFFVIGTVELIPDLIICIAEGYATGASIHLATGYPVVLSFVANNLPKVGKAIRSMYPDALLVYCADDDSAKKDTGVIYANEALAVTGGIVVPPKFEQV